MVTLGLVYLQDIISRLHFTILSQTPLCINFYKQSMGVFSALNRRGSIRARRGGNQTSIKTKDFHQQKHSLISYESMQGSGIC